MQMKMTSLRINTNRREFIGGSDARIIMGNDEAALIRLWREKRGEAEPEDLSSNLIVSSAGRPRSSTAPGTSATGAGRS
jgi:predicted phage-related endonuclease